MIRNLLILQSHTLNSVVDRKTNAGVSNAVTNETANGLIRSNNGAILNGAVLDAGDSTRQTITIILGGLIVFNWLA